MPYVLHAIYDANGNHVGFVDGPFVLDRHRKVVAELRAGVVVRIDGHVPGTFAVDCFLDARARVVAVVRQRLPVPRFPFGVARLRRRTGPVSLPRSRRWSGVTWRQYMQFQ